MLDDGRRCARRRPLIRTVEAERPASATAADRWSVNGAAGGRLRRRGRRGRRARPPVVVESSVADGTERRPRPRRPRRRGRRHRPGGVPGRRRRASARDHRRRSGRGRRRSVADVRSGRRAERRSGSARFNLAAQPGRASSTTPSTGEPSRTSTDDADRADRVGDLDVDARPADLDHRRRSISAADLTSAGPVEPGAVPDRAQHLHRRVQPLPAAALRRRPRRDRGATRRSGSWRRRTSQRYLADIARLLPGRLRWSSWC